MKQFFITFFAVLAALTAFIFLVPIASIWLSAGPEIETPDSLILTLDLNGSLREAPSDDPLSRVIDQQPLSVPEVVSAIIKAGKDDRVKGLSLYVGVGKTSIAQAQEIRDTIAQFKTQGKFVLAYAQQFSGPSMGAYYLAAASDQIWLQPTSELNAAGMAIATPFVKKALEKIGVSPQFGRRHEYKTAGNLFIESDFTEPHRESLQKLIESIFRTVSVEIAADRELALDEFIRLVDIGPHAAEDALTVGLVDKLGYWDQYQDALTDRAGDDAQKISISQYLNEFGGAFATGQKIALVYGVGTIKAGQSSDRGGAILPSIVMGGDTIAQALSDAAADPDIKAILFRVSSPGGSYLASDQIWRAALKAREAGKPIIVSMGATAASGGYFVAMAADKVLAQPGTITGSIGVLGGKMVTEKLLENIGVRMGEISVGENALLQSSQKDYTPEQWDWINQSLDRVYKDFVSKVSTSRNLTAQQTDQAARGRIWSGSDALEIGLIDELGGLAVSIERAKELGGIDPEDPVELVQFPREKSVSEQLLTLLTGLDTLEKASATLEAVAQAPYLRETLSTLNTDSSSSGVLSMPPLYELN